MTKQVCPISDDNDVKCENIMTKEEIRQDGMCERCATLMWGWLTRDEPIVFIKPNTREFDMED